MSQNPDPKEAAKKTQQSILLLVLLVGIGGIFIISRSNQATSPADAQMESKIKELQIKIEQTEKILTERGIDLPANQNALLQLSQKIVRDAEFLHLEVTKIQQQESKDSEELQQANLELQAALTTNMKLSEEASQLRKQIAQASANMQNIAEQNQQIQRLQSDLALRDKQIAELTKRPTPETVAQFRASLNETMLTNEKLNNKIAELEAQALNTVSNAGIDEMKRENEEMRAELQRLRADNDYDTLYAKSSEELRPEAALLYAELEKLEDLTPEQLELAYTRISQEHNAHMVRSVPFKTSSSDVGWNTLTQIKDTISTAPKDSFFLIVGYASQTGNLESNETLSAKRSVTIASVVKHLKGGTGTRAVFLGQTDRFSKQALDNQICEIWELRK